MPIAPKNTTPHRMLKVFIARHSLPVRRRAVRACAECLDIMQKTDDRLHDIHHIKRILSDFSNFLDQNKRAHPVVRKRAEEILFSICAHDTWKAQFQPKNPFGFFWSIVWDGRGSMKIAQRIGRKHNIEPHKIRRVSYAIKMHAMFVFSRRKTFTAKLLYDLDCLDYVSRARVEHVGKFFEENPRTHRLAIALKTVIARLLGPASSKDLSFIWFRKEYKKRGNFALRFFKII